MSEYAGPEPGEDYFAGSAITDWAAEHLTRGQDLLDSGPKTAGVEAGQEHWLKAQAQFMASIAVSLYEISQRPIPSIPEPLSDVERATAVSSAMLQATPRSSPQPTMEELREIISRKTREDEARFVAAFEAEQKKYTANRQNDLDNDEYEDGVAEFQAEEEFRASQQDNELAPDLHENPDI